jgi:HME family heavy-metal exporter
LPPFNEGTLLIGMRLNPGVTLAESSALARQAECWCARCPRSRMWAGAGRAELDEHAEGVHVSELDVGLLAKLKRSMAEVQADIRSRLVHAARRHWHRPAHLAPHRPHAVGRALADRHQALW